MNDRSIKCNEFFRTEEYNTVREYNAKREIKSVDNSITDLSFDESTHRKNGYSSSSSSRREKQKNTNRIVALATAGTASIVAIVAVVLAAFVGVSFLFFTATDVSISCQVDIPEKMSGDFTGVLYDADGQEVSRCDLYGYGKLTFVFEELVPDTEYYFSVLDSEGKQYLYETVHTQPEDYPVVTAVSAELFPQAARITFDVYDPLSLTFEVTLEYDEASGAESETFAMPDDGVVTVQNKYSGNVRIIVNGSDGIKYFDNSYPLLNIAYSLSQDGTDIGDDYAKFTVVVENPSGCGLFAVLVDTSSGIEVARAEVFNGSNPLSFTGLAPATYDAVLVDGLGRQYGLATLFVGQTETG